jgi:4'-phosphopantetheinyl transferase
MPVIQQYKVLDNCEITVWKITETPDFFMAQLTATTHEWADFEGISHSQKRLEWLASRYTLQCALTQKGLIYKGLQKDESGKPHLIGHQLHISLTHTKAYVGVVLNETKAVGIDMELLADKIQRIERKFMNVEESIAARGSLQKLCLYWCAKEALYKLHGKRNLSFKAQIQIENFNENDTILKANICPSDTWLPHRVFSFCIDGHCGAVAV